MVQSSKKSNPVASEGLQIRPVLTRVLVVDDEEMLLRALRQILTVAGYAVVTTQQPSEALRLADTDRFDVALLDVRMPDMTGIELLEKLKSAHPDLEVVMMTAFGTVEDAFRAVKLGAFDFLKKPFENIDEVVLAVAQAAERGRLLNRNRYLESQVGISERFDDLIGRSRAMREVFGLVESAAPSDASILIQGESGTGKELLARSIHRRSPRAARPLVAVNCGAITETLLESELFGHVRGAFTGASHGRKGYFEEASGGTLFLDEVGEMSAATQVKLLRVLQSGEIMRVGSSESRTVDVRVIAATNVDLAQAKEQGRFREDLFYRLNVIPIVLPPLRERPEDIPLLAGHFLAKYAERSGKPLVAISPEAMDAMVEYHWPGNVRELENVIEAAVVLARGEIMLLRDFRADFRAKAKQAGPEPASLFGRPFAEAKNLAIAEFERKYVEVVLERTNGNISEAARLAGLDRSNFRRVMSRHNLEGE
ncbi:MAG: sigma-54-dependent Fis family transcriptional regulator [Deltaproteobacteria bacterium]|nr:sigma-54-dependent Fis family transcriptional regulator [Deltaproteobacteria bacterium]